MSYGCVFGTGRIVASQADAVMQPRWRRGERIGVVYAHGGNGVPSYIGLGQGSRHFVQMARDFGYPSAGTYLTALPWGNATAQGRVRSTRTYLQSSLGARSGGVIIFAVSQGTAAAMTVAADHPDEVLGVVSFLPAFDLDNLRELDPFNSRAGIDAAWGVTYPTPLPADANPALRKDDLADMPILMFYATNDGFIPTSVVTDWVADMPNAQAHSVGALDHTDAAIAAADSDVIASFIRQVAAV